jgi:predicted nucleotidyltransferase
MAMADVRSWAWITICLVFTGVTGEIITIKVRTFIRKRELSITGVFIRVAIGYFTSVLRHRAYA